MARWRPLVYNGNFFVGFGKYMSAVEGIIDGSQH
jgi:hypothetical protein